MLHLIPAVKSLKMGENYLSKKAISFVPTGLDARLVRALNKLPVAKDGAKLTVDIKGEAGEGYTLTVGENSICITADSTRGAFYATQTLRQLFIQDKVPCLQIADAPDFPCRGFYHDITRGRISKVETILSLVEDMAYYKLNSFQLYVEHVFPFAETEDLVKKTGCITPEELKQIEACCYENFIEFIPSLSTFGHMYEILNQPVYKNLAVLKDYVPSRNFWFDRMRHHTIDPLTEGSEALVESLIDQYYPLFESKFFNICCDETFDLDKHLVCDDPGKVYSDFVKKIIAMVKSRGKDVMMWADILLKHPEVIDDIPEDTVFLNWNYKIAPPEENVAKLAAMGKKQIVCPGNTAWNRLCEDVDVEEGNISLMAHYGKKYGALGVLNTNWGDWGHPANLELGMYGLVLGAEKSWSEETPVDDVFYSHVDCLLYGQEGAMAILKEISRLHSYVVWKDFVRCYVDCRYGEKNEEFAYGSVPQEGLEAIQKALPALEEKLSGTWKKDNYRMELLCAAQGLCVLAELSAKLAGREVTPLVDTAAWIASYSQNWLRTNKKSELYNLTDMFSWCAEQ